MKWGRNNQMERECNVTIRDSMGKYKVQDEQEVKLTKSGDTR